MFYRQGTLVLEDGTRLRGVSFGYEEDTAGELVFTTGMVGYPESLTDPSYRGQILVMTYPIVGNYGVPNDSIDKFGLPQFFESDRVQVSALIVADYSHHHSHWNSQRSLSQWLTEQRVPALYGLDTRLLTKKIREKGSLKARIEFEKSVVLGGDKKQEFVDVNQRNLVAEVSITAPKVYGKGNRWKVLAIDCGIKVNIIRALLQRDCEVTLLPWDAPLLPRLAEADGVFLSNGPGDPSVVQKTIGHIKEVLDAMSSGKAKMKPVFGICLGNQLLGTAAGATTYKLPFGNRGQNQPVTNLLNDKCVITPQNHGYALDATKLPEGWQPSSSTATTGRTRASCTRRIRGSRRSSTPRPSAARATRRSSSSSSCPRWRIRRSRSPCGSVRASTRPRRPSRSPRCCCSARAASPLARRASSTTRARRRSRRSRRRGSKSF